MKYATLTFETADGRKTIMHFTKEGKLQEAKMEKAPNMTLMETCEWIAMLLEVKDKLISTFTAHAKDGCSGPEPVWNAAEVKANN